MKATLLIAAAVVGASLASPLLAASGSSFAFIKTNTGKVYTNCRVFKADPDGVIIAHQDGGAKLLFSDLTEESRDLLGYDAQKEASYEKQRAEAKAKEREELWNYRRELAKAQAAAYAAEAKRMEIIAVQNLAGGYGGGWGYGYGWDGGYGWGGAGFANGCYDRFGQGFNRFARFPYPWGFSRGGTTFPAAANFGGLNTRGRTFFGPKPRGGSIGTPSMGRLTPALGASGKK
jgi:hypothetical protein